jgi:hypothetical protein
MQLSDLQNSTAYILDDLQFGYFTLTQVTIWLNNAQRELQKRLLKAANNRYNLSVTTPLVVNQSVYVLPADFKKLHNLEVIITGTPPFESTNPIQPITENQKYLVQTGNGTPFWYTFVANNLYLRPAPDTALTMRMIYSYMVKDMVNATDVPDVPTDYEEMLPLLAAEDGFIKDGRTNPLLEKKIAAYQAQIDSDAQERNQDQTRSVVETGNSADQGFFW